MSAATGEEGGYGGSGTGRKVPGDAAAPATMAGEGRGKGRVVVVVVAVAVAVGLPDLQS